MNDLLRKEDLETNPTPRVPICLCLDVSGSMGRVVGGQTRETGRREFRDGKWWRIVKGGVTALQEMIAGVNLLARKDAFDRRQILQAEVGDGGSRGAG